MERISLTSSDGIPLNSPVIKLREFEFQVSILHKENDELRAELERKTLEIARLQEDKKRFEFEQEEAERRYMELEDSFLEIKKQLLDKRAANLSSASASSTNGSIYSSPYNNNNNNNSKNYTLNSSEPISRPMSLSPLGVPRRGEAEYSNLPPLTSSQSAIPPPTFGMYSPLSTSDSLVPSAAVVPSISTSMARPPKNVQYSPTLTSCVVDSTHLEVSVVPSPTAPKKGRKKSIISLFAL